MITCMKHLALILLVPVLLPLPAAAQQPGIEAYTKLPVCRLAPDGRKLAVEPCRTAPPKRPMPRRPVPLAVEPMGRMAEPPAVAPPPVAPGPVLPLVLEPRQPVPALPPSVLPPSVSNNPAPGAFAAPPPGPGPLVPAHCGAGGCRDINGTFYGGAPGSVTVAPNGRQCVTSASGLVQCF